MARLRAAIVGAGLIAGKKHIPAFLKCKDQVELAAICDVNLNSAQQLANRFGIPGVHGDFAAMLQKERLDVVDICTPPQTHKRLALEAMRAGAHVLVEKPMASTIAECDEMVDASHQSGRKLCVAHSTLFYYPFMKARELVKSGAIGEFRGMRVWMSTPTDYMASRQDHWAHKLPGGLIGETGPHAIYMSLAFINPVRRVTVDAFNIMGFPWCRFDDYRINLIGDKAVSSVTINYTSNQWSSRVDLFGSEGILRLDLLTYLVQYQRTSLKPSPVALGLLKESAQILGDVAAMGLRVATRSYRSTQDIIVQRFMTSIQNGTPPPVSAEEGRDTIQVLGMIAEKLDRTRAAAATED